MINFTHKLMCSIIAALGRFILQLFIKGMRVQIIYIFVFEGKIYMKWISQTAFGLTSLAGSKIVKISGFVSVTINFLHVEIMGYYRSEYRVAEF